jgi:hypothetical protein
MKPKYQIAMLAMSLVLIFGTWLLHRWPPRLLKDYFGATSPPINLAVFRLIFFLLFAFSFSVSNVVWFSSIPRELQFAPQGLH